MSAKYMTAKQLAEHIGVDITTIWRWRREVKDFPSIIRLGPNSVRFVVDEVEAWINARREK